MHDLAPFLTVAERILARHALEAPGGYARWTLDGADGPRSREADPYGCADAANLLYTLGRFPREAARREAFVTTLRALQDPADGLVREATHHPIHTTAHVLGALELFDAGPAHPLRAIAPLRDPDAMERFLDALDWKGNPWIASHQGAGLAAALWLAGETTRAWEARYVAWIARETDPATGLLRRGCIDPGPAGDPMRLPALAGTFHYLFMLEHLRQPIPHARALVDTCLDLERRALFPFSTFVGFAEVDWAYALHRAVRHTGHRADDARRALRRFAARHLAFLEGLDPDTDPGLDDLHALFGTVCALAELQRALPGELASPRPLRLVLDRRPFL